MRCRSSRSGPLAADQQHEDGGGGQAPPVAADGFAELETVTTAPRPPSFALRPSLTGVTTSGNTALMGKIRRGNYVFITWVGDHSPQHVHVYRDSQLVVKWDLENHKPMKG